jgi:divalent metal cation (Fe/Co/Zn/Cd) transporter
MAAATPLDQAHAAAEELRHTWLHDLPTGSTVDIHIDPYTPGDIHAYHHGPEQEAHT